MFRIVIILILFSILTQAQEIQFDEREVKERLEALNKKTPLELIYNSAVAKHIKSYIFKGRSNISKMLSDTEYYFPIIEPILDSHNVPLELKYLPVIESRFNPTAKSPVGARGMWQIMFNTAKEYDLIISSYVDERMDVVKSTNAACKYFLESNERFNDWTTSIASYNAGKYGVLKAIKRSGGKKNYWQYRPFLPKETREYVPKLIAAIYIMNYASEYGIYPKTENNIFDEDIDTIHIKRKLSFKHLASVIDLSVDKIEDLNPSYKIGIVPNVEDRKFYVNLPIDKIEFFIANKDTIYKKLDKMEIKMRYPNYEEMVKKIIYKIKPGDSMGKLAAKFNCSIKDIMLWNGMKKTKIISGKILKIYVDADYE
jgi:membrane-bound lytic murein transglycosylase D